MEMFKRSIKAAVSSGKIIQPDRQFEVFWTPSLAAKLDAASQKRGTTFVLAGQDMVIGTYNGIDTLRLAIRREAPNLWLGTEIHHVVANEHLQFVGRKNVIGETSYRTAEPCVLLPRDGHRLVMHNLINDAAKIQSNVPKHNGVAGLLKAYDEYREKNSVKLDPDEYARTCKANHRAEWVADQPNNARERIASYFESTYSFAYHQPSEQPLDGIAAETIRSVMSEPAPK